MLTGKLECPIELDVSLSQYLRGGKEYIPSKIANPTAGPGIRRVCIWDLVLELERRRVDESQPAVRPSGEAQKSPI